MGRAQKPGTPPLGPTPGRVRPPASTVRKACNLLDERMCEPEMCAGVILIEACDAAVGCRCAVCLSSYVPSVAAVKWACARAWLNQEVDARSSGVLGCELFEGQSKQLRGRPT